MREYFGTLLCVACICGVAEMLAPNGNRGGLKRQVRFICALTIVCVVAAPIGNLLVELKNQGVGDGFIFGSDTKESEYERVFLEYVEEQNATSIANRLKSELCERFDISCESIDVTVVLTAENDTCTIKSITVFVGLGAITKDPHMIIEYVKERTNVECEIIYK